MSFQWDKYLMAGLMLAAMTSTHPLRAEGELPPNWKAGGQAKKDHFYHRQKSGQGKPILDEANFEPETEDETRKKIQRHALGLWGAFRSWRD